MGTPRELFELGRYDPTIYACITHWKLGYCSFNEMLSKLIERLQDDCNTWYSTKEFKSLELENTPIILGNDLIPDLSNSSEVDKQSQLINTIIYISRIKQQVIRLVDLKKQMSPPPNIMIGDKEFKFVGKLSD
jgi:hypothetical protein